MIKKGNLLVPPKKDTNGEIIVSFDHLDLDKLTEEQATVIQVNDKAKYFLYNGISEEEYKKIFSFETVKEMWDKLAFVYVI